MVMTTKKPGNAKNEAGYLPVSLAVFSYAPASDQQIGAMAV
jgi:hypothetical protein